MIQPGAENEPLPSDIQVFRLAQLSLDGKVSSQAFYPSTEDIKSSTESITVWVTTLTTPLQAKAFMGTNPEKYTHVYTFIVNEIRNLRPIPDNPKAPSLDVVWVPLAEKLSGASGHAGITGLVKPPGLEKTLYKSFRSQLADLANKHLSSL